VEVPDNFTSNFELRPLDARNIITVSIVSLMYAEHVLRVPVDWPTLPSTGFGRLSEMYLMRKPTQIPYVAVPVWFRSDPALLDDPKSPIPANREPWLRSRPCKKRRFSANNELDRDLGAVFAQMEMIGAGQAMTRADGADGMSTRPNGVLIGADGVFTGPDGMLTGADGVFTGPDGMLTGADGVLTGPDGVLTGPDGVMAWLDGVEIRGVHIISAEEQSKLLTDVAVYKARISFLESKLAELGFTEDASTMTPSFGLKNSLKRELWNNQKIKRKTKHQCPQLQFFL
jgi:hypothetical protein